jgi:hypothetical protein
MRVFFKYLVVVKSSFCLPLKILKIKEIRSQASTSYTAIIVASPTRRAYHLTYRTKNIAGVLDATPSVPRTW